MFDLVLHLSFFGLNSTFMAFDFLQNRRINMKINFLDANVAAAPLLTQEESDPTCGGRGAWPRQEHLCSPWSDHVTSPWGILGIGFLFS